MQNDFKIKIAHTLILNVNHVYGLQMEGFSY